MSREILFRGKKVYSEGYAYGLPGVCDGDMYIEVKRNEAYEVSSFEQYTNINDKNGNKIFEYDDVIISIDSVIGVFGNGKFKGKVVMLEGEWLVDSGDGAMSLWSETNIVELVK